LNVILLFRREGLTATVLAVIIVVVVCGWTVLAAGRPQRIVYVRVEEQVVALTFDDGPSDVATEDILDILAAEKVKATFFLIGREAEERPALVARIVREGHEIGNHTYSHRMTTSVNSLAEEVARFREAVSGVDTHLFRFPGFYYNGNSEEYIISQGLKVIGTSLDCRDWRNPPKDYIVNFITRRVQPGDIIVLHDGPPGTVAALPEVIRRLKEAGYSFATVSELLEQGVPQTEYR